MELVTIREYAKAHHVSYEAIRKQVILYSEELDGHIIVQNRTQYLDEYAVEFLTQRRRKSPVVVTREDNADQIRALQAEIDSIRSQLVSAQNQLLQSQQRIIEMHDAQQAWIETKAQYQLQEKQLQAVNEELKEAKQQIEDDTRIIADLKQAKEAAQAEADSYTRSWFGFYRKKV